jgi:hypothetical protein
MALQHNIDGLYGKTAPNNRLRDAKYIQTKMTKLWR